MRRIAIASAVASYAVLVAAVILAGAAWPEYDHLRMYMSELGAAGAPHGRLMSLWGFIPSGVLLGLFAVAAYLSVPRSIAGFLGFGLLLVYAASLAAAGVWPCDFGCRPENPSNAQMLHDLWGAAGYLPAPLMMGLLAVASRRWPGAGFLFPLGLAAAAAVAVTLPLVLADHELAGLAQRVLEGAIGVWVLAFAAWLAGRPAP